MDFNDADPSFDEILNGANFPPHYDQLELDSLLYGDGESTESSSSYGFCDQNAGPRSRDSGSMGNSSTDSSPPLSCANFTENDQEMWEFGFQNPSPFASMNQQFDSSPTFHEEHIPSPQKNGFMTHQYFEQEEVFEHEPEPIVHAPPRKVIAIMPKSTHIPVKRVVTAPIQKVYRIREAPQTHRTQSFRIVQQMHPQQAMRRQQPTMQPHRPIQHMQPGPKPVYYTDEDMESHVTSGPLIRQGSTSDPQRYVPIAPTRIIKQEVQKYSPEQNRKIRNRMYAQASRIRKKEADENMRHNYQELQQENETLKNENAYLKQRLAYYENEDPQLHGNHATMENRTQKKKKMIAAGTALMMFGLFAVISPFHLTSTNDKMGMGSQVMVISNGSSISTYHHGRTLDSNGGSTATAVIRKSQENMNRFNESNHHDCEMYKLNATEARRVNNDIDRWVQVHSFDNVPVKFSGGLVNKEAVRKFNDARRAQKSVGPQKESVQKKADQAAIRSRERTWRQLDLLKAGNDIPADNEKLQRKRQNIDKIASIIRQKSDMLYIMTLQDYVLLPSLSKGANSIPKLSLLLPSVPMNGTMLDQYSLLRVDCEITGTGQLTLSNKQLSYLMP